jgi:protein-tyrosine phosphatase
VDHLRHLPWEACLNARDIGGYPTSTGRETAWHRIVRSDNLVRLTPAGQTSLIDYGVRTVIDVRSVSEVEASPSPFGHKDAHHGIVTYVNEPFLDEDDTGAMNALQASTSSIESYTLFVDRFSPRVAAILTTIARAPSGGVVVNCHSGKDRTGVVIAFLLELAGVPDETIRQDYVVTNEYLHEEYARWLEQLPASPEIRAKEQRRFMCWEETIQAVLDHLRERHGGVEGYLRASGVAEVDLERLRTIFLN